jgi:hypothetical protein
METILVNGKKYDISFIDTEATLKNMIALNETVLAEHVKIKKFLKGDIKVELLKNIINVKLEKLLDTATNIAKEWNIPISEIALAWLEITDKTIDNNILTVFKKINSTDFSGISEIEYLYKEYKNRKKENLKKLIDLVDKEKTFREEYAKIQPVQITNFLQDSIIIEYTVEINNDPLEVFDAIELSLLIPFVQLKTIEQTFYKVAKNTIPENVWLTNSDSTFTFKINNSNEKAEWGTATLQYDKLIENRAILTIESTVGANSSEEMIKKALLDIIKATVISRQEKGIKGVFAIPEIQLNLNIFLDLITNEKMVSHFLYTDETKELTSQKGLTYLYYSSENSTNENIVTVFLSDKRVTRSDSFYIEKELALYTPYINIRVSRAANLDQIKRFMTTFSIIFGIYQEKYNDIVKEYNKFIPGFKSANSMVVQEKETGKERLKALQQLDSELFVYGYPVRCEKKKQPMPVTLAEKKIAEKQGKQVLNYPTGSKNFFICPTKELPYPGLVENKFANNDKYEYLPCCYPENQRVGNKKLNIYLKGEKESSGRIKNTNIISRKAAGENKLGYLPRNIYKILQSETEINFYRQGVAISKNSFIAAVMLAIDPNYETTKDKQEAINDLRKTLAGQSLATVSQQLYDQSPEQIRKDIRNPNVIFDSKLYIGLLEEYYSCQIVVFEQSANDPNGDFEYPRYTQGYLFNKLDPNKNTVLIYKHQGARGDYLEFPHYETIIKKQDNVIYTFFNPENDSDLIKRIYSYYLKSYRLNILGIGRYLPTTIDIVPIGQTVDQNGKTRGYIFENNIYIAFSPIQPLLNIPIVEQPPKKPTIGTVQKFINTNNLNIIAQDIYNNQLIGVSVLFPNIYYAYIPIVPGKILSGIPLEENLGFAVETNENILQETNKNKKIADYMIQYLLYSFSHWYKEKSKTPKNLQSQKDIEAVDNLAQRQIKEKVYFEKLTREFLDKQIIVKESHDYKLQGLSRKLTLNSSYFDNGKLIANSDLTKQKLSYYLNFIVAKNKGVVLNYYEKKYLNNFYTLASDFKESNQYIVFIGDLSIINWMNYKSQTITNYIHKVPILTIQDPYFFSHWAINGNYPIIMQNVKNGELKRALRVALEFTNTNINIGYDAEPLDENISHAIYYFINGQLIKNGSGPISVWKYSLQDPTTNVINVFYTAMLFPVLKGKK